MNARESILELKQLLAESIIGQEQVIERLLVALLANGNVLMEGLDGYPKPSQVRDHGERGDFTGATVTYLCGDSGSGGDPVLAATVNANEEPVAATSSNWTACPGGLALLVAASVASPRCPIRRSNSHSFAP